MTSPRIFSLAAMALSMVLATGCGIIGGDSATPTPTVTPTQVVVATATQPPPSPTVPPPPPTATPTPSGPTTYIVEPGDNPTLIARNLGVPEDQIDAWVEEMLALNGTEATFLQVGQELILPPIDGAPVAVASPQPEDTPAPDETATPSDASPTPAASATPASSPAPQAGNFGDGVLIVGVDVLPGTYRTRQPAEFCYWARLSGDGGSEADIIADSVDENGVSVVTILATDAAFESDGCGIWSSDLSAVTAGTQAPFSDGTYIVGTDIAPGTWRTSNAGPTCYWERTSGFGASLAEVLDSDVKGPTVNIQPSDSGFYTAGCGTWTYVP